MRLRLAELCESLLLTLVRLLLPPQGRHRAATAPTVTHSPPAQPRPKPRHHPLDLQPFELDTDPVRPYLLTPEELRERSLRRQRRRTLWLATYGIDVGPRRIHGVEVAA